MGFSGTMTDFNFLGSKITEDGDCNHGIQRRFLLRRKAVTNVDSMIKKQRHHFANKIHTVKAMVFLVVMCGCESWTIKKLSTEELLLLNCGGGEDS